ncbi:MAG: tRNA pseudouridine(55) synthase TruB [Eggerthellaceae bacterium]|nr:tRNA pseudouridine(55) synthase TruB [Eggerthellaceae bacterium]
MRRGSSGLSFVIGVDKPAGPSSHDVVNRARRVFDERRIGHTGTLDPLASGALLLCVGPATRLSPYLQAHDKRYRFTVVFGEATETDDAAGAVTERGAVPDEVCDLSFAQGFVSRLAGTHQQVPPAYSAVKVGGERSYKAARAGRPIGLKPREVTVFEARLLGLDGGGGGRLPSWDIAVHVSKGTYVRSLARDIGQALGCPSHVGALRRTGVGAVTLDDCQELAALEQGRKPAVLDPAALLGYRVVEVPGDSLEAVRNGRALPAGAVVAALPPAPRGQGPPAPGEGAEAGEGASLRQGGEALPSLADGELVSAVTGAQLLGLFSYDAQARLLRPECVFSQGVDRG